jgi:hypothetical protein
MRTERRRYPRKRIGTNTTVVCTSTEGDVPISMRSNLAVKLVDVGGKGACIVSTGRLREGLPILVEITIPEVHERFRAKGVIRWSQTWVRNSREANVSGLEFTEVLEASGEQVQFLAQGSRRPRAVLAGGDLKREHRSTFLKGARLVCRTKGFLTGLTPEGFQMTCSTRIEAGRRLEARLDFISPRMIVTAEVEVRSCKRDTLVLEPRYEVEAAFAELPPESRDNLEEVLNLLRPHSSEGPKAP